jgi:hypothetical protein
MGKLKVICKRLQASYFSATKEFSSIINEVPETHKFLLYDSDLNYPLASAETQEKLEKHPLLNNPYLEYEIVEVLSKERVDG